jgi:hypothetical protein
MNYEEEIQTDEFRQRASNNVYHSIEMLDKIESGWMPDDGDPIEDRKNEVRKMYDSNLQFLKNSLEDTNIDGFLDRERVENAIKNACRP